MRHATKSRGFTLIEMIVAMVIGGLLLAMVGMFVRHQIDAYVEVSARMQLADAADTALGRMEREIRAALPNSLRVSGNYLEFVPIMDAGRYRAESGGGADFSLDFGLGASADHFDVLGPPVRVAAGEEIVVFNLGVPGGDVYAGDNRRAPSATGAALTEITAAAPFGFPFASPASRFHVVGQPVTFVCDPANRVIRRHWGYGFHDSQPDTNEALAAGNAAVLVDNLDPAGGCSFAYIPGALQRNGLVSLRLTLTLNGETVSLQQQIPIDNTP